MIWTKRRLGSSFCLGAWGEDQGTGRRGWGNQGKGERVWWSRSSRWQGGGSLHFCAVGQPLPDLGRMQPPEEGSLPDV